MVRRIQKTQKTQKIRKKSTRMRRVRRTRKMYGGEPQGRPILSVLAASTPIAPTTLEPAVWAPLGAAPAVPVPNHVARISPQFIDFPRSVPKATLMPYLQYITQLSEIQQYTIAQYTYHGDIMINALLRGIDTIDTYIQNIPTPQTVESNASLFEISCLFLYILAPELAVNEYFKVLYPKIHRVAYYQLDIGAKRDGYAMNHWDESGIGANFRQTVPTMDFITHKRAIFERYRTSIYPELKLQLDARNLNYFREKTYDAFKVIFTAIQSIPPYIPYDPLEAPRKVYRGVSAFYIPRERRPFIIGSFLSTSVDKEVAVRFADRATGGLYEFLYYSNTPSLYLASLSRFPTEYEMLFCPGIRFLYIDSNRSAYGLNTDVYIILGPDSESPVGTTVPDTYDAYKSWEQTLEVGRTPVQLPPPNPFVTLVDIAPLAISPPTNTVSAPQMPLLPASPVENENSNSNLNLYAGGSRRRLSNQDRGLNPKRNKTYKKLNMNTSRRTSKSKMPQYPIRISGDRWDSKLPIKYMVTELSEKDKDSIARIKAYRNRSE